MTAVRPFSFRIVGVFNLTTDGYYGRLEFPMFNFPYSCGWEEQHSWYRLGLTLAGAFISTVLLVARFQQKEDTKCNTLSTAVPHLVWNVILWLALFPIMVLDSNAYRVATRSNCAGSLPTPHPQYQIAGFSFGNLFDVAFSCDPTATLLLMVTPVLLGGALLLTTMNAVLSSVQVRNASIERRGQTESVSTVTGSPTPSTTTNISSNNIPMHSFGSKPDGEQGAKTASGVGDDGRSSVTRKKSWSRSSDVGTSGSAVAVDAPVILTMDDGDDDDDDNTQAAAPNVKLSKQPAIVPRQNSTNNRIITADNTTIRKNSLSAGTVAAVAAAAPWSSTSVMDESHEEDLFAGSAVSAVSRNDHNNNSKWDQASVAAVAATTSSNATITRLARGGSVTKMDGTGSVAAIRSSSSSLASSTAADDLNAAASSSEFKVPWE